MHLFDPRSLLACAVVTLIGASRERANRVVPAVREDTPWNGHVGRADVLDQAQDLHAVAMHEPSATFLRREVEPHLLVPVAVHIEERVAALPQLQKAEGLVVCLLFEVAQTDEAADAGRPRPSALLPPPRAKSRTAPCQAAVPASSFETTTARRRDHPAASPVSIETRSVGRRSTAAGTCSAGGPTRSPRAPGAASTARTGDPYSASGMRGLAMEPVSQQVHRHAECVADVVHVLG